MATKWTKAQQNVIDNRQSNLLVSAAAGSGKTAVLVQHIIERVLDSENPVDVDKLMVVTFTNAAAGEMRERIMKAIEKAVQENPENRHLQKQLVYIHNAKITTLHSYCLNLIKENFNRINIDPGFRIGDTGEIELLKNDTVKEVIEEYYQNEDIEFEKLIKQVMKKNSDYELEEHILRLYENACSNINPKEWVNSLTDWYDVNKENTFDTDILLNTIKSTLEEVKEMSDLAVEIASAPDGPETYLPMLEGDNTMICEALSINDVDGLLDALNNFEFAALSRKKCECSAQSKEQVKALRDEIKKKISDIVGNYGDFDPKKNNKISEKLFDIVKALADITNTFIERFAEKKREKNIVDFNDIEHLAIEILLDKHEGEYVPSDVADNLAKNIEEVIVDEYQDINKVQDSILQSLSSKRFGKPNMFMVGDVKQSIYGFRKADPELFMEKYYSYSKNPPDKKIILDKNFRSRAEVIDSINYIFRKIMFKKVGGIDYDEENELHLGADYPEHETGQNGKTELILATIPDELKEENKQLVMNQKEFEAKVVADRIREIVSLNNGYRVYDRDKGTYRNATYKDVLILLRSAKSNASYYLDALSQAGIPAYYQQDTGYFDTVEVQLLLSLLKVIDNPHQDVELIAVLKSIFGGLDENELATIRSELEENEDFYSDTLRYVEEGKSTIIADKLLDFFDMINKYRKMATYTSINDLITCIIEETGFDNYVLAMPAGERRYANIEMLKQKAIDYENGSYKGLFNFVRYIDKIREYEVDSGEASGVSESDDLVRIMSIHKSKGLEFPIVFLCNASSKFNDMDVNKNVVIHKKYGIGLDYIDTDTRISYSCLHKNSIKNITKRESREEELRVLYVALTRAKEKLIIVAGGKKVDKYSAYEYSNKVNSAKIVNAGSYMDFIGYALGKDILTGNEYFDVKYISMTDTITSEVKKQALLSVKKENFYNWNRDYIYSDDARTKINNKLQFKYKYESAVNNYAKVSVSDIKHRKMEENEEIHNIIAKASDEELIIPEFIKAERKIEYKKLDGASRGTAYHRVFELYDFDMEPTIDNIKKFTKLLLDSGKIDINAYDAVAIKDIEAFAKSTLSARMKKAYQNKKLFREAQFVMGLPENEVYDNNENELVLVQGIIDVYFEEENEIVIADYKTDRVKDEEELIKRYESQLIFYKKAVEQITGKKVKELIIYSVSLRKEIVI